MEGKATRRRHRLLNVWTRKGCGSRPLPSAKPTSFPSFFKKFGGPRLGGMDSIIAVEYLFNSRWRWFESILSNNRIKL